MDHRQRSTPKTAVVLILLLSVLLLLLHPTNLGNAPAVLILATCFLFGIVYVAACRLYREEAQFLPRFAFRSALFDRPPPFLSV
jgi:hypothetical protein